MVKPKDPSPNDLDTIESFEVYYDALLTGEGVKPGQKVKRSTFLDKLKTEPYVGVDHKFRTQWLKDNGYEVNRETLIDATLAPKAAR